jgi:hypothetical protein
VLALDPPENLPKINLAAGDTTGSRPCEAARFALKLLCCNEIGTGETRVPTTADFTNGPVAFTSAYQVLVVEAPGLLGALATGQNHVIAPMLMTADFSGAGGVMANTAVCRISAAPTPTSVPCYFLPYLPNGATTMMIGAAANYFFTSMMTGCTVQVFGPAATPTITHSNAANAFNMAAGDLTAATTAAQIAINNMLPAPAAGQLATSVSRLTMNAAYTPANMATGRAAYPVLPNYHIKEVDAAMVMTRGTNRPELGMFTFGFLTAGNWAFYAAVSTTITGRQKQGRTWNSPFGRINFGVTNRALADGVVLGPSARFWP